MKPARLLKRNPFKRLEHEDKGKNCIGHLQYEKASHMRC